MKNNEQFVKDMYETVKNSDLVEEIRGGDPLVDIIYEMLQRIESLEEKVVKMECVKDSQNFAKTVAKCLKDKGVIER